MSPDNLDLSKSHVVGWQFCFKQSHRETSQQEKLLNWITLLYKISMDFIMAPYPLLFPLAFTLWSWPSQLISKLFVSFVMVGKGSKSDESSSISILSLRSLIRFGGILLCFSNVMKQLHIMNWKIELIIIYRKTKYQKLL